MTVGDVIKRCRKIKRMTMKNLGSAVGFTEKNADSNIANYEADHALPSKTIREKLASVLGISEYAICRPSLETELEIMHTLFKLDSEHSIYVGRSDNRIFTFIEPSNEKLKEMFDRWYEKQSELRQGKITQDEYDLWKYGYNG